MIQIYDDQGAEMMKLVVSGEIIFEGYYWDLVQDPSTLHSLLINLGLKPECIQEYTYIC